MLRNLCAIFLLMSWFADARSDPYGSVIGAFNGVEVRSNLGHLYDGTWQCVEFVRRYYTQVFGINLQSMHTGNANTWYSNAGKMNLASYPNGSKPRPQVGDILVSSGNSSNVGHIAVIRSVTDTQVCVAEQNFNNDARDVNHCMPMSGSSASGYTVSPFGPGYAITGWLRPMCGVSQGICSLKRVGDIAWYPAINDCTAASQWFLVTKDANGEYIRIGSTTSAACPAYCPAP